jgi:uronate dehydrogenase
VSLALRLKGHFVRGFDLRPASQPGEHRVGSVEDVSAVRSAAEGINTVVHLAGVPEREKFAERLVPVNIVGTHNVLEAARMLGIRRVVYASSCRVVGGLDWEQERIGLEAGFCPGDHYGISKATGELLVGMYASRFGMSVVCARLGWFVRNEQEASWMDKVPVGPRIYLSHDDAAQFFVVSVEAMGVTQATVFVTSHNSGKGLFDLEPARTALGYEPKDSWPQGSRWSSEVQFPSPVLGPSLMPDGEG